MQQRHVYWKYVFSSVLGGLISLLIVACGALVTSAPKITATGSTLIKQPYSTPSAAQVLYDQPLTQASAGWASNSACSFSSIGLDVQPQGGQAYICLAPLTPPSNVSVTVTVQQISGSGRQAYGIVFRHSAPHNYDFFGIDSHGHFTLTIVVNDVKRVVLPFTASKVIHQGLNAVNELQVIIKGQQVTLLINETPVGQAILSAFARGGVGLRGIDDGHVLFRHLVIAAV